MGAQTVDARDSGAGASTASPPAVRESGPESGTAPSEPPADTRPAAPTRFHGSASLDPNRLARDVAAIAGEIIQHLALIPGATVRVHLEVEASAPGGIPEDVVRTVLENSRTLKVEPAEFE